MRLIVLYQLSSSMQSHIFALQLTEGKTEQAPSNSYVTHLFQFGHIRQTEAKYPVDFSATLHKASVFELLRHLCLSYEENAVSIRVL